MSHQWRRSAGEAMVAALLCLAALPAIADTLAAGSPLGRVAEGGLCVTNGAVTPGPEGLLAIDTPSARAFAPGTDGDRAEIRFRYLGPTAGTKPLASGERRRQIGIKLHAQDGCNLLYVMWHIEPDATIAVSIKRNPNQRTHAQCGAHGYTTLRPSSFSAVPRILPGDTHSLRAELQGGALVVTADGRPAWVGTVGDGLAGIVGPAGFRTDNGRFAFDYFASNTGPATPNQRCVRQPSD